MRNLRTFVIAGSLDGRPESLGRLRTLVQERRPDGVLYAGNLLAGDPAPRRDKLAAWREALDGLGSLGVFTAVVPGAADAPLRQFLQAAKGAEMDHPDLHVAHATLIEQGDLAVCGLGGDLTECEDRTEDRLGHSRAAAEYFLRSLWRADQPHKVLLLSVAPRGQLGGADGNRVAGEFIDSYHPSLCVVAGATERQGVQRIAHTLVVNPGRLADGCLAWLDLGRVRDEQVEFLASKAAVPV